MRQSHSVTDIASSGREKQRSRTGKSFILLPVSVRPSSGSTNVKYFTHYIKFMFVYYLFIYLSIYFFFDLLRRYTFISQQSLIIWCIGCRTCRSRKVY